MDNRVIDFVKEHAKLNSYFNNRNFSKRSFWENRDKELAEYVFCKYEEYNSFLKLSFSTFIRSVFLGETGLRCYRNIEDFIKNFKSIERLRFNEGIGKELRDDLLGLVDFIPRNPQEAIYCFKNNLRKRPLCYHDDCKNETEFTTTKKGYRKFCSSRCQMNNNNSLKEAKFSKMSDDDIRKVLEKMSSSRKNLTNKIIADFYVNIFNYSKSEENLDVQERIYLFQNNLPVSYIDCPHCNHKKSFISVGVGYRPTCGKNMCIHAEMRGESYFPENQINLRRARSRSKEESGFIYLLRVGSSNTYKIGITNDPNRRLKRIKRDVPNIEMIFCVYKSTGLADLEYKLHKRFDDKRHMFENAFGGHTEFFDLDEIDLKYIKEKYHEVE